MFHVDDFDASGTSEEILDDFEAHLKSKYDVTSNTDGVFLGIEIQKHGPEMTIFRRPSMLQNIFDMYLPKGPTMTSAPRGPMQLSYIQNFDKDDSPPVLATEFRSMIGMIQQSQLSWEWQISLWILFRSCGLSHYGTSRP